MLGVFYILGSVTLQAFVLSKVSYQFSSSEVMAFSVLSFFLCSMLFGSKLALSGNLKMTMQKGKSIALLNVHTLLAFGAFHLALIFLPASSAALFEAAIALLFVAWLTKENMNRVRYAALIVLLALGFVVAGNSIGTELLSGLVLSALAGLGAATISVRSNKQHNPILSTDEALAYRFLLSGVVTLTLANLFGEGLEITAGFGEIALLSLFGFVLPFFLLQKGMEVTKPTLTISMLSIIPAISYFIESVLYAAPSMLEILLLSSVILGILVYSVRGVAEQFKQGSESESRA